jgi:hypothetical protein
MNSREIGDFQKDSMINDLDEKYHAKICEYF